MKYTFLLLLAFLTFSSSYGLSNSLVESSSVSKSLFSDSIPSKYTIRGTITGLKDTTIYLANYFGDRLYYNDTTEVDSKGNFSFEGKPFKEGGKYSLVISPASRFDFIIAEEDIVIKSDMKDLIGNLEFVKSKNNQIFYEYINYITNKRKERTPCEAVLKDSLSTEEQKEAARDCIKNLNQKVIDYQGDLIKDHQGMLVAKYIQMTMDVVIPDAPKDLDEVEANRWKYYWYRAHYWDNVDLTDPRIVRDNSFDRVIKKFVEKTIPQIPDSVLHEARILLNKVRGNDETFKYILHKFTFHTESSKVMCMDRAFVTFIDEYYKTGQATWMTDEKLKEIIEAADKKKPTLCGEIAPNIILPDTTQQRWVDMHKIEAEYTIVVIWEPGCGHCKKEMPKLLEVAKKYESDSVFFYVVGNDRIYEPWMKFIRKNKLYGPNWVNVSDNEAIGTQDSASYLITHGITTLQSLNFRKWYNVTSTPQIFLLDADKQIIAKQLTAEQIEEYLANQINGIIKEENVPIIKQDKASENKSEKPKRSKKKSAKSSNK